jgi:hypothetical protein
MTSQAGSKIRVPNRTPRITFPWTNFLGWASREGQPIGKP